MSLVKEAMEKTAVDPMTAALIAPYAVMAAAPIIGHATGKAKARKLYRRGKRPEVTGGTIAKQYVPGGIQHELARQGHYTDLERRYGKAKTPVAHPEDNVHQSTTSLGTRPMQTVR